MAPPHPRGVEKTESLKRATHQPQGKGTEAVESLSQTLSLKAGQSLRSNVLATGMESLRAGATVLGMLFDGLKEHIESEIKRESSFLIEKRGGKTAASWLSLGVPQTVMQAGTVDCDFLVCHRVPSTCHSA